MVKMLVKEKRIIFFKPYFRFTTVDKNWRDIMKVKISSTFL